jgi:hypothetical protein
MESERDIVKGYRRRVVIVTQGVLVTDERRPVKGACVDEVGSKT